MRIFLHCHLITAFSTYVQGAKCQYQKYDVNLYTKGEITAYVHVQNEHYRNLTKIITNIGTTNPHMAPLSVFIQQLYLNHSITYIYKIAKLPTHHHLHIDHEQLQQK